MRETNNDIKVVKIERSIAKKNVFIILLQLKLNKVYGYYDVLSFHKDDS